jgi:hypothetical protein
MWENENAMIGLGILLSSFHVVLLRCSVYLDVPFQATAKCVVQQFAHLRIYGCSFRAKIVLASISTKNATENLCMHARLHSRTCDSASAAKLKTELN